MARKTLEDVFLGFMESADGYRFQSQNLQLRERTESRRRIVEAAVNEALGQFETACSLVKSPIEELFLCAIWAPPSGWGTNARRILENGNPCAWLDDHTLPEDVIDITPQAPVGPYTADFLVELRARGLIARVVVELDGHDFHEKTKQQAAHDKKRDRFFAAQGLTLLRFTGSEIVKDAAACAGEVLSLLSDKMGELWEARR